VRDFIVEMWERQHVTCFRDMKVLVLTSPEALDFKQIFIPLGFKNHNFTIVERDREAFEQISKNPDLDGCRKLHMDLEEFKEKMQFDLIYLDFKSNLCRGIMEIIKRLIIDSSHDGTIFYINVQATRETGAVTELYDALEDEMIRECKEAVKTVKDRVDRFKTLNEMVADLSKKYPSMKEYAIREVVERSGFFKGVKEPDARDIKLAGVKGRVKSTLETTKVYHAHRQHMLRYYVRLICDLHLNYTDKMREVADGKNASFDVSIVPSKDASHDLVVPVIRYLSRSLSPHYFTQIVYRNKSNKPFLSSMFVLKDLPSLLRDVGYDDFTSRIMRAFMILQLARGGKLRQKNYDRALYISKVIDRSLSKVDSSMENVESNAERDVHADLVALRKTCKALEDMAIFKSSKDGMAAFDFIDTNLRRTRCSFNATIMYKQLAFMSSSKVKRVDESETMLSYFLAKRLLDRIEKDLEFSTATDDATVINFKDDDEGFVLDLADQTFEFVFVEDAVVGTAESFLDHLRAFISECVHLMEESKKPETARRIKNAGLKVSVGTMQTDARIVTLAAEGLMLKEPEKDVENMTDEKTPEQPAAKPAEKKRAKPATKYAKQVAYEFVANNPEKKADEIATMVNEHVLATTGMDPGMTDCQVRAYKFWHHEGHAADS